MIDIDEPLAPRTVGTEILHGSVAIAVQFRYTFVTDRGGLKTTDVIDPSRPKPIQSSTLPPSNGHRASAARTYPFVVTANTA